MFTADFWERACVYLSGGIGLKCIPYTELGGRISLSNDYMAALWGRMLFDGTAKTVFMNGRVTTVDDFISFMRSSNNLVHLVAEEDEPLMIAWLNNIDNGAAQCHFNAFSNAWGGRAIKAFKACFWYWFGFVKDGEPVLRIITGVIPSTNKRACSFAEKVGTRLGEIPNLLYDAYSGQPVAATIFYTERDKWVE